MDIRNLGNWVAYPNGGIEGDYLFIPNQQGTKYRWNKYIKQWENAAVVTETTGRQDFTVSDLQVQNEVHVGSHADVHGDLRVQGVLRAGHVKQPNVGLFATLAALQSAYPTPEVGMWAVIGDSVPGYVYRCNTAGTWEATGGTGGVDDLENVVLYGQQSLTEAEKEQARENIGVDTVVENAVSPIEDEVRPFIISGTTEDTWRNIWSDENNPIPAGSIIENNGDLDVNVYDTISDSPGSYNYVLLPANSSLTCEWAVYRFKTTRGVGSYSLKVHKNGTLEGRVTDLEEKVKDLSSPVAFATGEQVSDVSIVDDLSSEVSNAVPSVEAVNFMFGEVDSKFEETDDTIQELNNELYGVKGTLPTVVGGDDSYPARYTGEQSTSVHYRNYTVDLTGAYARGFRKVVFYGFSYKKTGNTVVQGIIATGKDGNDNWIVELYILPAQYQAGYCEFPITANSTTLVATITKTNISQTVADRYPDDVDVHYVPSTVALIADEGGLKRQVQGLDVRVAALEEGGTPSSVNLPIHYFPSILYGVIGETQQEFVRGMVASMNPYQYYNKFVMSPVHGKVYKRYLEITPELVNGQISSGAYVKHCIVDDWYNTTPETNTPIKVTRAADLNVPSGGLNVLCIGASTTNKGQWVGELYRRLTANDGTPTGYGLSNINFVGRKTGMYAYNDIHLEATGGWTWKNFYTPQNAIRFYVSGNPTVNIGTTYTFTGVDGQGNAVTATIAVAEVNVSGVDGEDNIRFIYASGSPIAVPTSQSGTLTNSGGDSITYVDYSSEGYAPFEDDGEVTFVPYVETYCGGKLDVLCCFMGSINIPALHDNDLNPTLLSIKLLLDTLHSEYPNCKVLIGTAIPFSTYYGLEDDIGASANAQGKYIDATLGAFRYVQMIDDLIAKGKDVNNEPYSNFCYLVNTFTEVDSENVFPTTTKAANTRMPDLKEVVGTNGAHPNLEGFMMIADSFCRTFANEVLTFND